MGKDVFEKYDEYLKATGQKPEEPTKPIINTASKFMYYLGWVEVIGVALFTVFTLLALIINGYEGETIYLRAAIVLPMGLWWGLNQIRKNKTWRDKAKSGGK